MNRSISTSTAIAITIFFAFLGGAGIIYSASLSGQPSLENQARRIEIEGICNGNLVQSLELCVDKDTVLEGVLSDSPLEHPVPPNVPSEKIGYLDLSYTQVVLILKEKINYQGKIKFYGTLEKIKSNCQPQQTGKCEYEGYRLVVDRWEY